MADIKKDEKRGTYYFVVEGERNPATGRRKQYRRRGFKSKKEAKLALSKLQVEIEEKRLITPSSMRFSKYADEWFKTKSISLKSSTQTSYNTWLKNNIKPYFGHYALKEITEKSIQSFIVYLSEEKDLSPYTVEKNHILIKQILQSAVRHDYISKNPALYAELPKKQQSIKVWNEEEVMHFYKAKASAKSVSRYCIGLSIALQTGMRMGEILGLRWQDIDFEHGIITMRKTLSGDGKEFYDEGKTRASMRQIFMTELLAGELKEHKRRIDQEKEKYGKGYHNLDLVVCTKKGRQVCPATFRDSYYRIVKKLGLRRIRFHDLRHSHATFLISQDVNPKIVQERLGHRTISVTLNTYTHVIPSMQKKATEKMDSFFKVTNE